jgi:hypothetical protein
VSINVDFVAKDSGGLVLGGTGSLDSGKVISGFGFGTLAHDDKIEFIDFSGIGAGATFSYTSANTSNTSGTLTVSGGGETASATLLGTYTSANFSSGTFKGTIEITDPSVHSANAGLFGSYIAGAFVTTGGGAGGFVASPTSDSQPPLLTHPHG